ncbi:phosphatidate cytidylyltransferase [Piscinibacter sp. XHJ-5]|uniref:phosphatidate cytidylyltransferase n=1 Tax=Piscinibacter sp. XHJ-5 TaxID=3037797 RepID=UPI002452AC18|nr:phosphatidate cytidylyltransferase [Piscinibacter sp. XHJ-5]
MLKQRVITAVVLLAVLLPALFAPMAWPFAVLTLVMIGAAGWEWARLNGVAGGGAVSLGLALAGACALALWTGWAASAPHLAWWLATLVWVLGGMWALRVGPTGWPVLSKVLRCALGLVALWTAWLALANAKSTGVNAILSIFCLVWAADIAAYFGGRTFGKRKLAPAISPGKSWEGVWSGMAGALALAVAWLAIDRSFAVDSMSLYSMLRDRLGTIGLVAGTVFLAAMSVVGDLVESLAKRSAGAKDSSQLLPGHGGVLDRIDALLPVFPLALALTSL